MDNKLKNNIRKTPPCGECIHNKVCKYMLSKETLINQLLYMETNFRIEEPFSLDFNCSNFFNRIYQSMIEKEQR